MANPEHLQIVQQGVEAWNRWRQRARNITADLEGADLRTVDLREADLSAARLRAAILREADLSQAFLYGADLRGADLSAADLSQAVLTCADLSQALLRRTDLREADLSQAHLRQADLSQVHLRQADLKEADLREADLSEGHLYGADLRRADLRRAGLRSAYLSEALLRRANLIGADLRRADLRRADLTETMLTGADVTEVLLSDTAFVDINLTDTVGLETCQHTGPSMLDHRTLVRSGPLPLAFLRGCGLPDTLINYLPSLLNEPFQFYSCFISYANKDHAFAERLHADLQNKGVRCWFAPEDMKIGDQLRPRIDETIRIYDKLLLILSKASMASQWVEQEVETALEREQHQGTTVLFPVRIDETVMTQQTGWPALIRRTRHIGDFRSWESYDAYQQAFARLLRDLTAAARQPGG